MTKSNLLIIQKIVIEKLHTTAKNDREIRNCPKKIEPYNYADCSFISGLNVSIHFRGFGHYRAFEHYRHFGRFTGEKRKNTNRSKCHP